MQVRLDGRRLPSDAVVIGVGAVEVAVPRERLRTGQPQCWVIVSDALATEGSADARRLGIPVAAIEVQPA